MAKCLAEGGFSENSISSTLDLLPANSKWHQREQRYRQRTVRNAINEACNDSHVSFNSPDDGTESRDVSEGQTGKGSTMDYTTKQTLTVYNASDPSEAEDGERVIRVELTNMNGTGDDGSPVDTDFVTIQKGTLRDNGEFGVSPEFNGDSKSVGQAEPSELRLIAEGLEELAEEIDDD